MFAFTISISTTNSFFLVFVSFFFTLIVHILSRLINKKLPFLPAIVIAIVLTSIFLQIIHWNYQHYYQVAQPLFSHFLGYVTVMLAIPLASLNFDSLPVKKLAKLILLATSIGALFPMLLAVGFSLSYDIVASFSTRSVTTPIGLNIASLIHAPLAMTNLIIIISGILGVSASRWLLKDVTDEKAKGLALGLVAHAFGTVEAWQISAVAGRYAAFGLAVNGIITAIWFPVAYHTWKLLINYL